MHNKEAPVTSPVKFFYDEAKILQRMKHPHIVIFYGVTSLFAREGLVMEFLEGGNLHELILSKKNLPWTDRLRLLHELISAINFLHNHDDKKAYIHGDIKPLNTLLTKFMVLKLTDFGAVNMIVSTNALPPSIEISPKTQHTWPYTAPEFFDSDAKETPAMDIYSFGIVVYELLTRIRPYEDDRNGQVCRKKYSLLFGICKGTRPNQSKLDEVKEQLKQHQDVDIFLKLQSLMKECWEHEPSKRPKAIEILKTLTKQMDELSDTDAPGEETFTPVDESPVMCVQETFRPVDESPVMCVQDIQSTSQQEDNVSVNKAPIPGMHKLSLK
ncbi:ankyrin repeat and protein kinase domain-containing protein 1-like [Ciona intestinalis]